MTTYSREAVQVSELTWTPFASPVPLLNRISFTLEKGERALLIGPSGSGKSTLLRALAGVLADTEAGELTGEVRASQSGLLLQDPNDALVSDTIYREVAFGLENLGVSPAEMPKRVQDQLNGVGLTQALEHPSSDLSGGEMQRMALAGLLAMRPELLLLDEPTAMLDAESAAEVRGTIFAEVGDSTVLVVEHQFADWLPFVSRLLVLNDQGELVLDGRPDTILHESRALLEGLGIWLPGAEQPKPKTLQLGLKVGGSITALTGRSGAGKTTELKRRLKVASLDGLPGYVPQQAELTIIGNTVLDSTDLTARAIGRQDATQAARQLLTDLDLGSALDANPYEISGGEQRRLAMVTALAHQPSELFLDEPTVGQDRGAWAAIAGAIASARDAGVKITLATHDEALIAMADEVIEITPKVSPSQNYKVPQISGLVALTAPLLLLVGSMAVTTVSSGILALTALMLSSAILFACGFRLHGVRVFIPGLVGIASIGLSNWYLSADLNLETGILAALRVSLFVLPGIAIGSGIQPIPLGDQLAQILRLPTRPVVAAVAAMQRMKAQIADWDELRLIHRIRAARKTKSKLGEYSSLVFALLLKSLRSAGTLAVSMDSRGFSTTPISGPRTWAKPPIAGRLDWLALVLAIAVSLVALAAH